IALDDSLAEGHVALAHFYMASERDKTRAETELRRALELSGFCRRSPLAGTAAFRRGPAGRSSPEHSARPCDGPSFAEHSTNAGGHAYECPKIWRSDGGVPEGYNTCAEPDERPFQSGTALRTAGHVSRSSGGIPEDQRGQEKRSGQQAHGGLRI